MRLLKQSTNRSAVVFMTDSADHVAGKTGLTLTITASKDGGSFGSITPTVTELANGWYKLALTTSHTDTLGDLALHITSTGADATDLVMQVVAALPGESVTLANAQRIQKNAALNNFALVMIDSADDVSPKTGLTVTATRSIDGGSFAACANSVAEVGNGVYKINLAATDLNGDVITFRFAATGANDTLLTIVTQAS